MIKYLVPIIAGPILLAWAVTAYLFGSAVPGGGSYAGGAEGWGRMFVSLSIMFCIAIWIGALFSWLLVRRNGDNGG